MRFRCRAVERDLIVLDRGNASLDVDVLDLYRNVTMLIAHEGDLSQVTAGVVKPFDRFEEVGLPMVVLSNQHIESTRRNICALDRSEVVDLFLDQKTATRSMLVVTHNIPSARVIADRMAFLDEGRLVAEGTADELEKSDNPLVRKFMQSKQGG